MVLLPGTIARRGETEPSSARTPFGKEYSDLQCAEGASGFCLLALPGAVLSNWLGHRSPCLKNPGGKAARLQRHTDNVRTSRLNLKRCVDANASRERGRG
jgi:hypothetical protein